MSDDWMRRIDALTQRAEEVAERHKRAFARHTIAFEIWERQQDEMREFMRELTLEVKRGSREDAREIRQIGDEFVARLRTGRGELLAAIDRLQRGDSGSAA